jgi:hypothetical protein
MLAIATRLLEILYQEKNQKTESGPPRGPVPRLPTIPP